MSHTPKIRTYFMASKVILDTLAIPFIVVVAYGLKFKVGWVFQKVLLVDFGEIYNHAQVEPYLKALPIIILIWIISLYFVRAYRPFTGIMPTVDEFIKVVKGITIANIQVMAVTFVLPVIPESRSVIVYSWAIGIVVLSAYRAFLNQIEHQLMRHGKGQLRALIIGANDRGQDVAEKMVLFPDIGYQVVGFLDDSEPEKVHYHLRKTFKLLGKPADFEQVAASHKIDTLFIAKKKWDGDLSKRVLEWCEDHDVTLKILSDFAFDYSLSTGVENFDGLPFFTFEVTRPNRLQDFAKRAFDFTVSLTGLMVIMPVMLGIALIIKIVSPDGPVLYKQVRLGLNGREFNILKFRTMVPNAEAKTGPVLTGDGGETRYIRFGKFLRRTSLDELPQLINVVKGEMSLVGPRPERPHFAQKYASTIAHFNMRNLVRGGITGWAQINGRSFLTRRPEHKIKYDLYYIKNRTFIFDLKILMKTIGVVLRREEAY